MWNKIKSLGISDKIILGAAITFSAIAGISSLTTNNSNIQTLDTNDTKSSLNTPSSAQTSELNAHVCDGKVITTDCEDENGVKYSKYIYHPAVKEVTETIEHPAEPAKTHEIYHEAVYEDKQVQSCIKANIGSYAGQCATYRCNDGAYSGANGSGGCSHHKGVAAHGPFYTYTTERYLISSAWTETVIDEPAKDAWTETKVITPAQEEYYEKEVAK